MKLESTEGLRESREDCSAGELELSSPLCWTGFGSGRMGVEDEEEEEEEEEVLWATLVWSWSSFEAAMVVEVAGYVGCVGYGRRWVRGAGAFVCLWIELLAG